MDDIMKTDVDEGLIAPYMADINRQFEYVDKEDLIKKMVSITFGRFLDYYKDAPEIVKPTTSRKGEGKADGRRRKDDDGRHAARGPRKAEAGFRRLFINLGKADGFYPGEIMQFVNHHVHGPKQEIGHIDLLQRFSYIEVPEKDANKVMAALNGSSYKGREVRCNDADDKEARGGGRKRADRRDRRNDRADRSYRKAKDYRTADDDQGTDWRSLMQGQPFKDNKGKDTGEEGFARRFPKRNKE